MSAELTAIDELAEAEMYVRDLAASWAGSGGGAKIAALLAEFDRRGQIEQRARDMVENPGRYDEDDVSVARHIVTGKSS